MKPTNSRLLHNLARLILVTTVFVAGIGVFFNNPGSAYEVFNQYGDAVKLYGRGLYAHDSYFKAPIFRGTDFIMLFVACPALLLAIWADKKRHTLKTRLFLVSMIGCFAYYAASIAFGVHYNFLHLPYILLFSAGFFGLIEGMLRINYAAIEASRLDALPYRGVYIFLTLVGVALVVAWLPDILGALFSNRALPLIETYTTEITYVLDMGIIAPAAFSCLNLLRKRAGLGVVLLDMLLTLCILIGLMLPVQTVFQLNAGIEIPAGVLVVKVGTFCALALFALYFKWQLLFRVLRKP